MRDGGRGRASLGVEVGKSSQKWSVQRSAVRSIAWLDLLVGWITEAKSNERKAQTVGALYDTPSAFLAGNDEQTVIRRAIAPRQTDRDIIGVGMQTLGR